MRENAYVRTEVEAPKTEQLLVKIAHEVQRRLRNSGTFVFGKARSSINSVVKYTTFFSIKIKTNTLMLALLKIFDSIVPGIEQSPKIC